MPFICKYDPQFYIMRGSKYEVFVFSNADLTVSSVQTRYTFNETTSLELQDSWEEKRMTGFRLSWFLQANNKTRLTKQMPDLPADWKPEMAVPMYEEQYLVRMVELAGRARANNITREEIVDWTMKEKAKYITNAKFQYTSMCSGGQVNKKHRKNCKTLP